MKNIEMNNILIWMIIMHRSTIVKQEGMNALISNLGYVDAERFIVLMSREPFHYTKWREEHLDEGLNVRQLCKKHINILKSKD